ncbi:sensor histidine kinase [Ideonella sp. BN130291]|uniref:sensor histidine kinase n=1 Tax=Ideonella sp. BN130291 TaxID=3112940 RepID=UPI002E261588|nr:sensor histidine kinase N-terminal domain-containing protein [Ideonella sp. BN130291]
MAAMKEQRSLFGEILDWMLAPLLLLWPMSVALTWLVAQGIASRPYDRELGEMARNVARRVVVEQAEPARKHTVRLRTPEGLTDLLRSDDTDQLYYQVLGLRGELVSGDRELPVPEEERATSSTELRFRDDTVRGEPVRIAYLWLPQSAATGETPPLVQVAETLDKRSRLATEIIKGVILPQFVILPLAVLLVWLALARGIAPLNELQHRIRQRESHDLSPIEEHSAPEEVAPLVRAINDLLARLDQSMSRQKHFLADAAHQLKTPLAGLRTQAELAQQEIDAGRQTPQEMKRSLQQIARSSQRAAHMVNQLLALARAEDREQVQKRQDVPLARLATETVRDFVPRAMDKRIDLGYEGPERDDPRCRLAGQPVLVRELIRNLVDNALQYTPAGGTVTVRLMPDPFGQVVVLQVEDSGPGIPEAERELVFQPFYRALGTNVDGSGLGLAIVREIAQQHGAEVTVEDAQKRSPAGTPGTRITVRFHAEPAAA